MNSRSTFDSLLTKNHVTYALVQADGHNGVSMVRLGLQSRAASYLQAQSLTTLYALGASPAQLRTAYDQGKARLQAWKLSPARIANLEDRQRHLGDARYVFTFPGRTPSDF